MSENEKFDILVKSTLDEGAEEVPAGLWEGVQKRMAAAEGAAAPGRTLWKRLAVGVAFACAAACCLLILVPRRTDGAKQVAELVEVTENPPATTLMDADGSTTACSTAAATDTGNAEDAENIKDTGNATGTEAATDTGSAADNVSTMEEAKESTRTAATAETREATGVAKATEATKATAAVAQAEPERTVAPDPFFDDYGTRSGIRLALIGSAMTGGHSGSRSSIADRMSTSQMDFSQGEKIYEGASTFHMIPISAGIGLRINFTKRWSLGVGINYTYLKRRFEGQYDYGGTENYQCGNISNDQHYIGIPLNAYYNIINGGKLKFYAYAGGAIEKCVSNSYSFKYYGYDKVLRQSVGGVQASVDAGLGIQFCINDRFGIYLDPSFRYYFRNYLQPKSLRTTQPFQINAELGLRWEL